MNRQPPCRVGRRAGGRLGGVLALTNSPEYRMKATVLEYYDYDRKMVKAKAWPKMEFNGNFGAAYENYEPLWHPDDLGVANDFSGPNRKGREAEAT